MPILFLIIFLGSCSQGPGSAAKNEVSVYPQLGHSHVVNTAVFSEDSKYIVSASRDMSVKLWDAESGRERATFIGHTGNVHFAVISNDNRHIASASQDGTVRVWDTNTEKEKFKLEEMAYAVVFGEGNDLYTLSDSGIKNWDLKTGKLNKAITEENFQQISFSPGSPYIVSGTGKLTIWDIKTGNKFLIDNDFPLASAMAINKDGKYIASGGWDGTVTLSSTDSGESVKLYSHAREITAITFSSDKRYLASASKNREIIIYDLLNNNYQSFFAHSGDINSLSFSADSRSFVSASGDKTVKVRDTGSAEEIFTLGGNSDPPLLAVASHDNQYIAYLNRNNNIKIWNAKTGVFIETFDIPAQIRAMCFSSDNEELIGVTSAGTVSGINMKTGKMRQLFEPDAEFSAIFSSFGSGGTKIVSVLGDGSIDIWDYENNKKVNFENRNEGFVRAVAVDSEGSCIAAGFFNGKLNIIDLETKQKKLSLQYESTVVSVDFSPDSKRLVCGLQDGSVRLLDVSTGKEIVPAMRHLFGVSSVLFSNDGRSIISGAADNCVKLWDAETGKEIASFISFNDDEWIAITADGYYNASSRADERLNVRIDNELYGMDQFGAVFLQAELVSSRLQRLPDPDSVAHTESLLISLAPPSIEINAPRESETGSAEIEIHIKDNFRPLNAIQIVINGRLLGSEELSLYRSGAKLKAEKTCILIEESINELSLSIPVRLEAGSNRVQVMATNRQGKESLSGAEGRKSAFIVNLSEVNSPLPDLWVLAIGSNKQLNGRDEGSLKYAVNNAQGIRALFESQQGKRYRNVHTQLIADGEGVGATRETILESISEFFGRANSNDVLVLFISGHGEDRRSNGRYYFLPQAISLNDIAIMSDMPGRKFIFIDSCFSGGVDDKSLARDLKNQSTVIFTSSQKDELSWEGSSAVPYGFFTEALITGISGDAALNNEVRLLNLGDYVNSKVRLLSGGIQNPYIYIPEGFYGFVVAVNN